MDEIIEIIEGWRFSAASSVFGIDGAIYAAEERAYERVLDLLRSS